MKSKHARVGFSAFLLALCVFPVGGVRSSVAQEGSTSSKEQRQNLTFKTSVRRVIVDVVVTDSTGKPVPGLTQRDFSLAEDGKPQKMLSFDVHNLESTQEFPPVPLLPPNTFVNIPTAPERGPLYVLLLDLLNTSTLEDQMYGRQQLLKFIKDKPSGTRFAVFVLSRGLRLVRGFTADKDQLYAAVDPGHPSHAVPRVFLYSANYGAGDPLVMVQVFTFLSHYLEDLPGRKNVIWFSGGFPFMVYAGDEDPRDMREDIKNAINGMVKAQIAVYPVHVAGVPVFLPPQAPLGSVPGPHPGVVNALYGTYMSQADIAQATGGTPYFSRNDVSVALQESTQLGGNFYTLTYSSSNLKYDGRPRGIAVKLSNKRYHAAYRRFYYGDDSDTPAAPPPKNVEARAPQDAAPHPPEDSLSANMKYGAPMAHEIYFRVHLSPHGTPTLATTEQMENLADQPAYFRVRRKSKPEKPLPPVELQKYVIDYTLSTQARSDSAARGVLPPVLEMAAAAYNADGQMLNGVVQETARPDPGSKTDTNSKGMVRVEQEIDVPVSAVCIRVAVRDISSDRIGAMEVALPLAPEPENQIVSSR